MCGIALGIAINYEDALAIPQSKMSGNITSQGRLANATFIVEKADCNHHTTYLSRILVSLLRPGVVRRIHQGRSDVPSSYSRPELSGTGFVTISQHRERFPRSWRCSGCMADIPEIGLSNGGNSPYHTERNPCRSATDRPTPESSAKRKPIHHRRKGVWTVRAKIISSRNSGGGGLPVSTALPLRFRMV